MAYRSPRYMWLHAVRDGIAGLSSTNTVDSDYPLSYLGDSRSSINMKFDSSASDHELDLDRGAGTLEAIDRLIIPAGHNLNGATIRIQTDDNSGFSSATTILTYAVTSADLISEDMTSSTERYVRWDTTVGTGTWEMPELVYTRTRAPTRGADLNDSEDQFESATIEVDLNSGLTTFITPLPTRRKFTHKYASLKDGDDTLFRDLASEVPVGRAFWIDPPSFDVTPGDDEPPISVIFTESPEIVFATSVPGMGVRSFNAEFDMLEHVL